MFKSEIRKTILLSVPIVVGQMLMSVVDNIMVGKLGAGALAAASLAHSLFMMIRFNAKSRKEIRLS